MRMKDVLLIAASSMRAAPLRTVLTALGIVVGIAAVIALVGFTTGMRNGFNRTYGDLSRAVSISKNAPRLPGTAALPLRESDLRELSNKALAPDIESVTPLRSGSAVIRYGGQQFRALLGGTGPGYLPVRNRTIAYGRMFTDQENSTRDRVIVLGSAVVDSLFGGDAHRALLSHVEVGRLSMRVVGVLSPAGQDQDLLCLTPLNSVRAVFAGADTLNSIGFMAASVQRMDAAVAETNSILDRLHKIASPGERDYTVQTNVAQLQQVASYISLIRWFTLTVAGIALFIGGLGVGNIMMVTVTERTSEIGVRRALGARRATILRQFLTEAVSLSGLGGIVGIGVGLGMVALGTWLLPRYAPGYGTPDLSWSAVLIAFAISLFIGLAAGGYPALRAARMQPIDALRY